MQRALRIVVALVALAAIVATATMTGGEQQASTSTTTTTAAAPPVPDDELQARADAEAEGAAGNAAANTGTQAQTATTTATTTTPADTRPAGPRRPAIERRFIPFPASRRAEMAAYSERHYGQATAVLRDPRVIVEHVTVNDSVDATYATFAPDRPDSELHELPGTCSHFVIARDGTIVQFVPLDLRCRHTVGLNWTAIGIEHVGFSAREILDDPRQLRASLRLTAWLRCRYGIRLRDVIGHNESLASPYHRENVARLRTQTHGDWTQAEMTRYRARLRQQPACA